MEEIEIEVGEYVRTKDGIIYRIENGEEFYSDSVDVGIGIIPDVDGIWIDRECLDYIDKRDIVKHSRNIVNLIEVGDFVNGIEVIRIVPETFGRCKGIELANHYIINYLSFNKVKTILTKEMYAQYCYKVVGEEECM